MWWMLRLLKFVALAMLAAGMHGTLTQSDARARRRAAFRLGGQTSTNVAQRAG